MRVFLAFRAFLGVSLFWGGADRGVVEYPGPVPHDEVLPPAAAGQQGEDGAECLVRGCACHEPWWERLPDDEVCAAAAVGVHECGVWRARDLGVLAASRGSGDGVGAGDAAGDAGSP